MKKNKLANVEVIVREQFHNHSTGLWFLTEKDGRKYLAKPIAFEFEEVSEAFMLPDPTMEFSNQGDVRNFLQGLSDGLNNNGFKSDNERVHGELDATKVHLDDMRKLVFNEKK